MGGSRVSAVGVHTADNISAIASLPVLDVSYASVGASVDVFLPLLFLPCISYYGSIESLLSLPSLMLFSSPGISNLPGVPVVAGFPSVVGFPAFVAFPVVVGVPCRKSFCCCCCPARL